MAEQQALQVSEPERVEIALSPEMILIERLVKDPEVSVDKLERILALQDQIKRRQAEEAFNIAFVAMQSELPVIVERGKGDKNITYAKLEDIVETVRPILKQHGFFISFSHDFPETGEIITTGILTHERGHKRESRFKSKPDNSGSKNAIQAQGSSESYGRRYTTMDLLNIVSREDDDDGKKAGMSDVPEKPNGFEDWFLDLEATAENGTEALEAVWNSSPADKKRYVMALYRTKWEDIKRKAAKRGK